MLGVDYGAEGDPLATLAQARSRRDLALCAPPRLSRGHQGPAEAARRLSAGAGGRRRGQGLRRHRAGDGEAAGRRPPGSAGRASTPISSRGASAPGCCSARSSPICALRAGRAGAGPLRLLPQLPRHLPDQGLSGALPARCAALHRLSHHRAQGPDSARVSRSDRQSRVRLRRLSRRLPLEQIRASRARRQARCCARSSPRPPSPISPRSTIRAFAHCSRERRSSALGHARFRRNVADRDRQFETSRRSPPRSSRCSAIPRRWRAARRSGRWRACCPREISPRSPGRSSPARTRPPCVRSGQKRHTSRKSDVAAQIAAAQRRRVHGFAEPQTVEFSAPPFGLAPHAERRRHVQCFATHNR